MRQTLRYDPQPTYEPTFAAVGAGWTELSDRTPPLGKILAIDGPMLLDWDTFIVRLDETREGNGLSIDLRRHMASWEQVVERTASVGYLADDPDFASLPAGRLRDLFDELPAALRDPRAVTVVFGPGAALIEHDVLWYADVPKRFAEAATVAGTGRNLGQLVEGEGSTRRLFYIDWPLLDRHRELFAPSIDLWIDAQDMTVPTFLSGHDVRGTLAQLTEQPFRTRPTFNTTTWGGHWAQNQLGFNTEAPNTALGYELIAPESGILIGHRGGAAVEVPFQMLVGLQPLKLLGNHVHTQFGTSFPVRFDYLDTVEGGSLSVHCHPQSTYMRDVFGWPYTQHETYYVMVGSETNSVYLGLHDDIDTQNFRRQAHDADRDGIAFAIDRFVQFHPASEHQLFLIPAGTPHGSGKGNVILEISATPYLYSLRFYDWLRKDGAGAQRSVHVDHAFSNLDLERRGKSIRRELIQQPRTIRTGEGWREDLIGALPEMFFEVFRIELAPNSRADMITNDRFQILNVVGGEGAVVHSGAGDHPVAYAETIVIPAAVGEFQVEAVGAIPVRVVKAFVR